MEGRLSVNGGVVTVKENVVHPGHDHVVGDLVRNLSTGQYYLLEYKGETDNYVKHSVPHAWAVRHDPRDRVVDALHRSVPKNDYTDGSKA